MSLHWDTVHELKADQVARFHKRQLCLMDARGKNEAACPNCDHADQRPNNYKFGVLRRLMVWIWEKKRV